MRPYPVIAFAAALALSACGQASETKQPPPPQTAEPVQQQQGPPSEQGQLTPASAEELAMLGGGLASAQVRSGGQCNTSLQGQVDLRVVRGQPDDGFHVILMCGSTEVARCGAHLSGDPATADCTDGPNPQPPGPRRCILGPRNGNSATAEASFLCPEL